MANVKAQTLNETQDYFGNGVFKVIDLASEYIVELKSYAGINDYI
jgi:hypothetical protein